MLSNSTPISIGPFALEKQPYDPVEAFTHIALIGTAPCVVMANPKSGLKTLADLEAMAKKAGRLEFGSGGPASIGHIYGELMKATLGISMVHVPYRGGAPMTTDLISGQIPVGIDVLTAFVPYFKSGQLVPLAVTSANRSPLVPDVPSVVEAGQKKLVLDNFFGLSGPAKMPADVVARLNTACNEILAQADIKKKMLDLGIATSPVSQRRSPASSRSRSPSWRPRSRAPASSSRRLAVGPDQRTTRSQAWAAWRSSRACRGLWPARAPARSISWRAGSAPASAGAGNRWFRRARSECMVVAPERWEGMSED
jgi:tripartite-type tricarboxylate transporter receptor subunit TctC